MTGPEHPFRTAAAPLPCSPAGGAGETGGPRPGPRRGRPDLVLGWAGTAGAAVGLVGWVVLRTVWWPHIDRSTGADDWAEHYAASVTGLLLSIQVILSGVAALLGSVLGRRRGGGSRPTEVFVAVGGLAVVAGVVLLCVANATGFASGWD